MSLPITQFQIPPEIIDLGAGEPNQSVFPLDMIHRAAEERLSKGDPSFLQYGAEQGDGYFRLALATFVSQGYGLPMADPANIFITAGISSALDLLCTLFTQAGDTIFVEETTYFVAPKIFADHHLKVIPIAMDENGLVIESLEENLKRSTPKFLYTIPIHHNPTGSTLTDERRVRLIELARQFDFLILADEVYQLLSYTDDSPKPFAAHTGADTENIISLGSFSKILAPGLRLGWIQAQPQRIKRLATSGLLDSGGGMNPFTSAIIRSVIECGDLEKHVKSLIETYRPRLQKIDMCLTQHLPEITYTVPKGGYFFWLRLPGQIDATELRQQAKTFNVDFRQGGLFSCIGGAKNNIRLCFAHYDEAHIEEGILRLKACLEIM
ncbi:MAG TPA: PLP-dependent aminotransferase family protein [Anaerolineales bacterium]|nr:PLP-dependent aminotransferase family protein [Anaerolineales bacterium]